MADNTADGVVHGHRSGHGFVVRDDGGADIYLSPLEMRAVLHLDRVRVSIVQEQNAHRGHRGQRNHRIQGRVLQLLERASGNILGRLVCEEKQWRVLPQNGRHGTTIAVDGKGLNASHINQIVVVEPIPAAQIGGLPCGAIREFLGPADSAATVIEVTARKYALPRSFSAPCLAMARSLPNHVRAIDRRGRVDLTGLPLVTIDGEDARDFDDAVYCAPIAQQGDIPGGWRLIVAIADVGHYVPCGSDIDLDAYERATSVYFPGRVLPMLPESLSQGLCSLNPDVLRLCLACDMHIGPEGDIVSYRFDPGVLRSHARLTYDEANALLHDPSIASANASAHAPTHTPAHTPAHTDRIQDLRHLHDVYQALLRARQQRGAMDLDTVETYVLCDAEGRVERIVPRQRNDAHRMIEEAMLAANVCSADLLRRNGHHALYRVHAAPTEEKLETLRLYLGALGVEASLGPQPKPADFQRIALATRDRPDVLQIHTMLLRSMQQAMYTPSNAGHFGLAYEAYAHFTSPIRRYPDLLVHRVIRAILQRKRYPLRPLPMPDASPTGSPALSALFALLRKKSSKELERWQAAGVHCSARERRADEAAREVDSWMKCSYLQRHVGDVFHGTISAVTAFGLFVTLEPLYIDGLLHISALSGEYYAFDEERRELRGTRSGKRYTAGQRVTVQVARIDPDERRIDLGWPTTARGTPAM
ncbi:ribonuclease R family protein [Candidatus Symbiobacter mobilis]|uniref:Ribonuclease R n=1 Tax=Candidatus Symbiobacter mobilis CR TaxID=946483 RepID=U5NDV0_9BURK|nr:VacB/RNase II family 3'-5' exoribonuclease [Candidatus Symbiobacter mobilis]AGX88383.1 ribonuclease R [Candidatus Symbiobacter mobilis CR]